MSAWCQKPTSSSANMFGQVPLADQLLTSRYAPPQEQPLGLSAKFLWRLDLPRANPLITKPRCCRHQHRQGVLLTGGTCEANLLNEVLKFLSSGRFGEHRTLACG